MSSKVIKESKGSDANTPPKTMTNKDIWLKILADQKLIREELRKGLSLKEIEGKHGFKFASLPNITD